MGVGRDLVVGEAAELVADHRPAPRRRAPGRRSCRRRAVSDQLGDAQRARPRCCRRDQLAATAERVERRRVEAEIGAAARSRPGSSGCRRRAGRDIRRSRPAGSALRARRSVPVASQRARPSASIWRSAVDIGREPGEAVRGELLALEQLRLDLAAAARPGARTARDSRASRSARRPSARARQRPAAAARPRSQPSSRDGITHQSSSASSRVRRPGRLAWTSTAMLPGLCWFFHILVWARGMSSQAKTSRHAGIDAALDHQLVGLARLQQVGEVAALDALLAHPDEAGVHGEVVAGGAGAEHHHAAALHHEARDREGLLAGMLEHEVDVVALAGDVPDRLAELAAPSSCTRHSPSGRRRRAAGPSSRSRCG